MLFDEPTLRKLNQLTLIASRVRSGAMKGERRSSRRGSSVEFADYRNYAPGDDSAPTSTGTSTRGSSVRSSNCSKRRKT
jgi:hypothetical protein